MEEIIVYNKKQDEVAQEICDKLLEIIVDELGAKTTSKLWHGAPVWFDDGNPVAGYSVRKDGVQLLFWSGMSFDEPTLTRVGDKYPTGEARYGAASDINESDVRRWLQKSLKFQWDYKNIVKRRGELLPRMGVK